MTDLCIPICALTQIPYSLNTYIVLKRIDLNGLHFIITVIKKWCIRLSSFSSVISLFGINEMVHKTFSEQSFRLKTSVLTL